MGIDHLIFGALMAIIVLLFATVAGVHRIAHVLNILEERSRPRQCRGRARGLENLRQPQDRLPARLGLRSINDELYHNRTPEKTAARLARSGGHPVVGRNPRGAWEPLDIPLVGADGALKRLAAFEVADLEALRAEAIAQQGAWAHRERFAERGAELLQGHKRAKRLGQLSKKDQKQRAELARVAWP